MLFFVAVTALFLDFTGTIHAWLGWTAKVQFLPALLAVNAGVVALLVLLTLLAGRVYCSVICPLGVMQDIVSWISGRRKKKKYRFSYSPEVKWLRYGVLGLFVIALIAGVGSFVALLAPYSSYGRIATNLFAPVYRWGNNLLAYFAERADSYAFYETEVWLKSLPTFLIAAVTFVVLITLAWRNGRTYCNTICPVGTVLGFFSRFSLFRPVIDAEKCKNCSLCSRGCKAACIDYKNHRIDYSRCVACMDCIDTCKHDALRLEYRWKKTNKTATDKPAQTVTSEQIDTARRTGGHRGQKDTGTCHTDCTAGCMERTPFCPALYGLPALRVGLSQQRTPTFNRTGKADAARSVLRTGILPSGVYALLRRMSRRGYPADSNRREIIHPYRSCRMDQEELHSADRRCGVRQLCPSLPFGRNTDGSVRQ